MSNPCLITCIFKVLNFFITISGGLCLKYIAHHCRILVPLPWLLLHGNWYRKTSRTRQHGEIWSLLMCVFVWWFSFLVKRNIKVISLMRWEKQWRIWITCIFSCTWTCWTAVLVGFSSTMTWWPCLVFITWLHIWWSTTFDLVLDHKKSPPCNTAEKTYTWL